MNSCHEEGDQNRSYRGRSRANTLVRFWAQTHS
eukprot:gene26593-biopygen16951